MTSDEFNSARKGYLRMAPARALACDEDLPLESLRLLCLAQGKADEKNHIPNAEEMCEEFRSCADEQDVREAFVALLSKNVFELCASGQYRINPQLFWAGDFEDWDAAIQTSLPMHISPLTFRMGGANWRIAVHIIQH